MANLAAENTHSNKLQAPSPATTKTAHTPGPWELQDEGDDHRFWIEAEVVRGNIPYREFIAKTYKLPGERDCEEANARLIAAAPDVLEALERLVEILSDEGMYTFGPKINAFESAKAAIQKARGGQ